MATMTKAATISVRLTPFDKVRLDADARVKGIPSGRAAAAYISEGVRRSQFPAVELLNGAPERVVYLAGSRWPIWLIVELVRELQGDVEAAAAQMQKPAALVKMALAYADAYPEEIQECLALHERRDFSGLKEFLPELELVDPENVKAAFNRVPGLVPFPCIPCIPWFIIFCPSKSFHEPPG